MCSASPAYTSRQVSTQCSQPLRTVKRLGWGVGEGDIPLKKKKKEKQRKRERFKKTKTKTKKTNHISWCAYLYSKFNSSRLSGTTPRRHLLLPSLSGAIHNQDLNPAAAAETQLIAGLPIWAILPRIFRSRYRPDPEGTAARGRCRCLPKRSFPQRHAVCWTFCPCFLWPPRSSPQTETRCCRGSQPRHQQFTISVSYTHLTLPTRSLV